MVPVKVLQAEGLPLLYPVTNQCWRCCEDPCVHVSGVTLPWNSCWMRSSPTAAAASNPSSTSAWVRLVMKPVATAFRAHTPA